MLQQFYGPLTYGRYLGVPIPMAVSRYGSPPKNCHLSAELAVGLKLTIHKKKTRDNSIIKFSGSLAKTQILTKARLIVNFKQ